MADRYTAATNYWEPLRDGRVQCNVCPRACALREGQRGLCFVRAREGDGIVLTTWGRSSGFCVDPIEKKPLNHFLPGSSVLSFGTAGCNLTCRFCQNWDMSKARDTDVLADEATPETIAAAAVELGCRSVAFTYNDPTVFLEFAVDVADACHQRGLRTVGVTAGYINPEPRAELFAHLDAANIDLKTFDPYVYRTLCGAELSTVLDTLCHVRHETDVWLELTTLLIPDVNDSDEELNALTRWVVENLGPDVPMHFTAFHPDYKMSEHRPTPVATLARARAVAQNNGVRFAYTGNVRDWRSQSTVCPDCRHMLVERDRYTIRRYGLTDRGACQRCGEELPGRFDGPAGSWGTNRIPVVLRSRR